jgi:hypothetical protein
MQELFPLVQAAACMAKRPHASHFERIAVYGFRKLS